MTGQKVKRKGPSQVSPRGQEGRWTKQPLRLSLAIYKNNNSSYFYDSVALSGFNSASMHSSFRLTADV